jgi:hypothetical protein
MSCDCARCREHYKTLGIAYGIPEEPAIEEAYRESVKQWHPDLYENFPSLRADAEEHFKHIQIAYRELKEHSGASPQSPEGSAAARPEETPYSAPFSASSYAPSPDPFSAPVSSSFSSSSFSASASAPFTAPVSESITSPFSAPIAEPVSASFSAPASAPAISFGGAAGCEAGLRFTPQAEEVIDRHQGKLGTVLGIVDLGGARARAASYSQFLLLASSGILMRDSRGNISLLWYRDLGEVKLLDRRKSGKPGWSQKLFGGASGGQQGYTLQVDRRNGATFCSISDQAEDSVKEEIYRFLSRQKSRVNF